MKPEHCAYALRRAIPESASEESIALFMQYQAMQNIVPSQVRVGSDPMKKMFDECRAAGNIKRLSVKPSKHFESVQTDNQQKEEEVLICTLPTSHRCKGYLPVMRK